MSLPEPALAAPEPATARDNPFKGLAYYERKDAAWFTGRQRDIEAVVNGILRTRTFVVYSRSGLGKTSLLLAGVLPRLAEQGCLALDVRLLEDPLNDLRRALVTHAGLDAEAAADTDLAQLVERAGRAVDGSDRLVVIAFDQFEEFFVRFADQPDPAGGVRSGEALERKVRLQRIAQREAFIREMGRLAADAHLNLRLVFSLREDWIAEMGDFADAIPDISHHMYRLMPLTSFGVRQAIVETLRTAGAEVDSRLVTALVDALTDVHFDPVVLQVLGSEVWERARARCPAGEPIRLELQDLEAVGGVREVFRNYLSQANAEIEPKDLRRKLLAGAVLEALISEKRTKLAVARDSLLEQSFAITPEELDEVLERLLRHRIVRSDPRGGVRWFELVHERLVGAILEWFEVDLDYLRFRNARNLVLNSCRNQGWRQNPDLLLTRAQLDETVGPFKELVRFGDEERLFLVSSAIYAPSRNLAYWAELAGSATYAELIERFLAEKENERLRWRGAEAAGGVKEQVQPIARRCLDLALRDPSQFTRQAAARSFAALAAPPEIEALARQLREKPARGLALDVLTEVADQGRIPPTAKVRHRDLWRVQQRLYRRRLAASRKPVRERSQRGLLAGMAAAFVWSLTGGALLVRLFLFELMPEYGVKNSWSWVLGVALYLLGAIPLGGWVGWATARKAARSALRRKDESPPFWSVSGKVALLGCGALILAWLVAAGLALPGTTASAALDKQMMFGGLGLIGAALLGLTLWNALLARCAGPVVRPIGGRRRHAWVWVWVWAFGGSLAVVPLVLVSKLADTYMKESTFASLILVIAAMCLVSFVMASASLGGLIAYSSLLALSYSVPAGDARDGQLLETAEAEPTPRARRLRRALGAALALASAVLVFLACGWDGLPFLAKHLVLGERDERRELGGRFADTNTSHFRLEAPASSPAPRLAGIYFPLGWGFHSLGETQLKSGEAFVLQPGQSRRVAIYAEEKGMLSIQPDHLPSPGHPFHDPQLVVLRLAPEGDGWTGASPGLASFSATKGPLYLSFGEVVQGRSWCKDAAVTAFLSETEEHHKSVLGLPCAESPEKVAFSHEVPWVPGKAVPAVRLKAWNLQTSLRHGDGVGALDVDLQLSLVATAAKDTSAPSGGPELLEAAKGNEREGLVAYVWPIRDAGGSTSSFQHRAAVTDVSLSDDGRWLATAAKDNKVRVWDVKDPKREPKWVLPTTGEIARVNLSAGVRKVIAESLVTAWIFDLEQGGRRQEISFGDAWSTARSADGSKFAAGGADGVVRIWDLDRPGPPEILKDPSCLPAQPHREAEAQEALGTAITELRFSPMGDRIVAASGGGVACVWPLGKTVRSQQPIVLPHLDRINTIRFSRDGSHILTASADGLARLWLPGNPVPTVFRHKKGVNSATFGGDGTHLVTASDDGFVRRWSLDGSLDLEILAHDGSVRFAILSPDGQRLLTVPASGPAQVWDVSRPVQPRERGDLFLFLRVSTKPAEKERRD